MERSHCSFGINPAYRERFKRSGFRVAGTDERGEARLTEREGHPFFVGSLFQPQLGSTPEHPHKLILGLPEARGAVSGVR